ncbi:hemolysin family protein [Desulfovibrio aminophilus]|nr:hemolysin family protein [Desulfovibrio aminophilus]MCM0756746.1 hemolysin family protein [Desulfovibrio aminophilus]
MLELILAVALSCVASAFCSVSEAAFYSFSWSRIEQLRKQGKRSGDILHALRSDVEKPIAAVLTLNTVANTAGASIAGAAWVRVYGPDSLVWFAAAFTALILLVGEIVPKTAGVAYSRTVMPALARPLLWLVQGLSPLVWVVGMFGRLVKRGSKKGPEATEEDIRALVSLTRRAGVLKAYEEMAIRNILSLDSKTVDQIMTPRTVVFSLPTSMTVAEARECRGSWPHSRIPVYEGEDTEDIVGVIFRRQVFEALADDRDDIRLADLMRPVDFVPENITLDKLLVKFLESRSHLFVVLDEYGGLAGVVTLEDVLEEILGSEIVDETDQVVDMRELARRRRSQITKTAAPGPRER